MMTFYINGMLSILIQVICEIKKMKKYKSIKIEIVYDTTAILSGPSFPL